MLSVVCCSGPLLTHTLIMCVAVRGWAQTPPTESPQAPEAEKIFAKQCAVCHGADARGGQYAPRLVGNSDLRGKPVSWFREVIKNGIPSGGMPGFDLPNADLDGLAILVRALNLPAAEVSVPGDRDRGEKYFWGAGKCGSCHMMLGKGAAIGPDLSNVAREMTVAEIRESLLHPSARITPGYELITVRLPNGESLRGFRRNESSFELVLQDMQGYFHLLDKNGKSEIVPEKQSQMPPLYASLEELQDLLAYLSKPIELEETETSSRTETGGISFEDLVHPKQENWLTYNGSLSGNRYSELRQINTRNAAQLQLKWIYTLPLWKEFYPDTPYFRDKLQDFGLETVPLVADGIMYATGPQQVFALDARTGVQIWSYSRPRTAGVVGDAALGTNRGLAMLGDKVFMVTDDAHMIALNRTTGQVVWETAMPEKPMHYGGTMAPIVVKDMVVGGVAGGDWGIRGFVAAYRASDGKLVWRRWTVPDPEDPEAKSWGGNPPETGGGATWITGSYDPETDTLFWSTGNPYPGFDGSSRPGDDLYTNCILALNPETGQIKWFYQVTPHDVHDWDATAPATLVDAEIEGQSRKLLLHADKNGSSMSWTASLESW